MKETKQYSIDVAMSAGIVDSAEWLPSENVNLLGPDILKN